MASEIERPRNCDNCRHATDYWPMYCGDDHRKWAKLISMTAMSKTLLETLSGNDAEK